MLAKPTLLRIAVGLVAVMAVVFGALMLLPVGQLRPQIEAALSRKLGTPVHVAHISRERGLSLSPVVEIDGLAIDQPAWAGRGHWAEVDRARFRLPLLPALIGRLHPSDLRIEGMTLVLVRTADGRKNWSNGSDSGSPMVVPAALHIDNSRIVYRDAKRDRSFDVRVATLGDGRLELAGKGTVLGQPVRVAAHGAALTGTGAAWPFSAKIDGPTIQFAAQGTMDRALDSRAMTIDVDATADDLKTLDAIIEAGLFHTQALHLRAHARHQDRGWIVTGLRGTIGHSRLNGRVTVTRQGERHRIDGVLDADPLDFADLSSSRHLAEQAALKRAGKQRLIPGTKVDLTKLAHTDGTIRLDARSVVGASSPPIRTIQATLRLDHSLLTVAPLKIGLDHGVVTGSLAADQRGRPLPLVTIKLALQRSDLSAFSRDRLRGALSGHLELSGLGRTIGQAVGQANGSFHLRAGAGRLPARMAAMLALDAGRALTRSADDQSGLRCAALDVAIVRGSADLNRLVIDTTSSQSRGQGSVDLANESVKVSITGAPKKASLVQLSGAILVTGTLAVPHAALPRRDKSVGAILKSMARAIGGHQPVAPDLDCTQLH